MRLEDLQGRRVGRYEVLTLLGRGGMAAVYRARDTALQRDIALKVLYPQYAADPEQLARFRREAVLAARLDHPNIVPIYDVGEADGLTFIAMKLITGRSLAERLRLFGPLLPAELLPIIDQIAAALDYAHAREVIHRDIKPANILLDGTQAVLTDFGIARALDTPGLTSTGALIGTPEAMAPEQIRGDRIDGRADVYALGVLIFRCLTGRPPYQGSVQDILLSHLEQSPPALRQFASDLPERLDDLLRRAMAAHPDDRYASAGMLAQDLREVLATAPASGAVLADTTPRGVLRPPVQPALPARRVDPQAPTRRNDPPQPIRRNDPPPPPPQRGIPAWAAALFGLIAGLLLLGSLILAWQSGRAAAILPTMAPTMLPMETASPAPTSTPTPSPSAVLTPTPSPSVIPSRAATDVPTSVPTAMPTDVPTTLPTVLPPTPLPTDVPTPTAAPTPPPSETSTPTAEPTAVPTATSTPTSAIPPTPTLCPLEFLQGGFGLLVQQNSDIRGKIGCPRAPAQGGPGAVVEQAFQRGSMFYFDPLRQIYVFFGSGSGTWRLFNQDELIGLPTPTPTTAPDGLYIPVRGFGLIWGYNADIREAIGYGTAPENGPLEGAFQSFQRGRMLYSRSGLGVGPTIYVLYADGSFERYDDPNQGR